MIETFFPEQVPLPLSKEMSDDEISAAWEWILWAVNQPKHLRVPPPQFKDLDSEDWLILVQELNLTLEEQKQHPVQ